MQLPEKTVVIDTKDIKETKITNIPKYLTNPSLHEEEFIEFVIANKNQLCTYKNRNEDIFRSGILGDLRNDKYLGSSLYIGNSAKETYLLEFIGLDNATETKKFIKEYKHITKYGRLVSLIGKNIEYSMVNGHIRRGKLLNVFNDYCEIGFDNQIITYVDINSIQSFSKN